MSQVVPTAAEPAQDLASQIDLLGEKMATVRDRMGRIIFGQSQVIDQTIITLLAGGHALVIGVPGLAKTRMVETLGVVLVINPCSGKIT